MLNVTIYLEIWHQKLLYHYDLRVVGTKSLNIGIIGLLLSDMTYCRTGALFIRIALLQLPFMNYLVFFGVNL